MRPGLATITALAVLWATPSAAEFQSDKFPDIWDVDLGMHVGEIPAEDFVEPACGSNGGPPSRPLGHFADFHICTPEASGLYEVQFIYDDELEYWAKAMAHPTLIQRYNGTRVMDHPVILSLLLDENAIIQGLRIITDPRAEPRQRREAANLQTHFKARFGSKGWVCSGLPVEEGERPIGGRYVKERCVKTADDGARLAIESRFYFKAGQSDFDRFTNVPTRGQFESSSRFEMLNAAVPQQ